MSQVRYKVTNLTKDEYDFLSEWMIASGAQMYVGMYEGSTIVLEINSDEFYFESSEINQDYWNQVLS